MRKVLLTAFMLCSFAAFALAQSSVGRINGTVSGPDGLLPGATVTLTDTQTGRSYTTTTGGSGDYKFESINFGVYTLKVTSDGFKSYVANNVKIDANRAYRLNPKLEIGDVTAEVTIQAGAELVNSSNAQLSTTVSPKQVLDLPINGRNPLALLNLQAGVNPTSNSINGQRSASVNYTRDGINVQDNFIRTGGFVSDRPTVDNTGEFTVVTQNSGAELGNGGSTQVLLVTPRGGKNFHGAGYLYNRNSRLAANEFGNNSAGRDAAGNENAPKPFLNRNQYGFKISGPVPMPGFGEGTPAFFKDKGFFFFNYERFDLRQQSSRTTTTLLPAFRDGTFNYTDTNGVARSVNILTGAGLTAPIPAVSNGVLAVDPVIQQRILANLPTSGNSVITNNGLTQRNIFNVTDNTKRSTYVSRIDVEIDDKNSIYGVFRHVNNNDDRPDVEFGFDQTPFVNVTSKERFFVAAWRTVIGSSLTNEFRVGYTDGGPFFAQTKGLPQDFIIGGLPFITDPAASFQDQGRATKLYTIQDNASYSFGNHTFRFGGEVLIQRITAVNNFGATPTFTLSTGNNAFQALDAALFPGGISTTNRNNANSLRALLGGVIGGGTVAATFQGPGVGPVLRTGTVENFEFSTYGFYVSDSWRVKPNLTLTLGLRYDYFTPLKNPEQIYVEPDLEGARSVAEARTALLDPTGQIDFVGVNSGTPGTFYRPDRNNFGPNIGVAYSPNFEKGIGKWLFGGQGRSTIRGGFRIGYINDEFVLAARNAGSANQGLDFTVNALQNGSTVLNARTSNPPGFVLPPFQTPPISFAAGNARVGNFFNTIFSADPDLQMQKNYEYSVGFQREIGWNTAIEIRYVGGASNNLHQATDFNQVNTGAGNFLNDFRTARNNCQVAIAANNAIAANTTRFLDGRCASSEYRGQGGLPGQVDISASNSVLNFFIPFFRTTLAQGNVADLAIAVVTNGFNNLPAGSGFDALSLLNNPNGGVVDFLTDQGKFRYNSLQFEVRRRFSDGLQFQANYNFQKILTDSGSDNQSRFNPFLDINNPGAEYARADYDRTHTINMNVNYELPFGKGKRFLNHGGWVDKIFGGFQLTGIGNISSGAPISIKDRNGTLNRIGRSNRQTADSSLTNDQIKDLTGLFFVGGDVFFINPSAIGPDGSATNGNVTGTADSRFPGQVFFRAQPGTTGNLQRAFLNGPWYYNFDAGIIKNIRFGERYRVQIRAEAFNVLNKTNWFIGENTNTFDIDDSAGTTFGQIPLGNTFSPRIMQLALRIEF